MATKSGRAAPMSPEARRQAILEAVAPVLLERGPDLSTRDIAEAAGVAEGTLFRVFADKHELLLQTCWHIMRPEAARGWLASGGEGLTLEEAIGHLVTKMSDGVQRTGRVLLAARSLGTGRHHPRDHGGRPPMEYFEESNREVIAGIADCLRPHAERLAVPPERAALMVRALVVGARHPFAASDPGPTVEEITHLLVRGLARSDDESPRS